MDLSQFLTPDVVTALYVVFAALVSFRFGMRMPTPPAKPDAPKDGGPDVPRTIPMPVIVPPAVPVPDGLADRPAVKTLLAALTFVAATTPNRIDDIALAIAKRIAAGDVPKVEEKESVK